MPTFEYHAIRAEGDEEKSFVGGVVIAKDKDEAKAKLLAQWHIQKAVVIMIPS